MNGKDCKNDSLSRRDFMKVSGISAGNLALGPLVTIQPGFAQEVYPAQKINFILPHRAGSGHDILTRSLSPYLSKYLKEVSPGAKGGEIQVKNEGAGGGRKGYSLLFNAKPDGYNFGTADASIVSDNILEVPEFDYTKLTFIGRMDVIVRAIVSSAKGFKSWAEVVSEMKKGPVKLAVGNYGSSAHIFAIIMGEKMGTNFKLVNFGGNAESLSALLRGDVQLAILGENAAIGLIDAGEARVLLRFSEEEAPGVVIIKKLGFPDFADQFSTYRFIVAPPGLETAKKNIFIAAMKKALNDPEFVAWAKKNKLHLAGLYGSDCESVFAKQVKFFVDIAPLMKKYLK